MSEKIHRIWEILNRLDRKEVLTFKTLFESLEVTEKEKKIEGVGLAIQLFKYPQNYFLTETFFLVITCHTMS